VPTLQDQCRYSIVKCCNTSLKLRRLPLPAHLVRYLLDFSPEDPGERKEEGEVGNGGREQMENELKSDHMSAAQV